MAQSRNEVPANLVDRAERLECNGKEMIVVGDFNIYLFILLCKSYSKYKKKIQLYKNKHKITNGKI